LLAVTRIQHARGQAENSAELSGNFVITKKDLIIHWRLLAIDIKTFCFNPWLDNFFALVIHRDAQDDESLGPVFLIEVDQPGNFCLAGIAPSGPEIYEHDLAFVLIEAGR